MANGWSNIFHTFFVITVVKKTSYTHTHTFFLSTFLTGLTLDNFQCQNSLNYWLRVPRYHPDGGLNIYSHLPDHHHRQEDPLIPIQSQTKIWILNVRSLYNLLRKTCVHWKLDKMSLGCSLHRICTWLHILNVRPTDIGGRGVPHFLTLLPLSPSCKRPLFTHNDNFL